MLYMHERRLSFMINSIKEGQIEKEENIMKNVSEYFGNESNFICRSISVIEEND